jgi:hypothetical protein
VHQHLVRAQVELVGERICVDAALEHVTVAQRQRYARRVFGRQVDR